MSERYARLAIFGKRGPEASLLLLLRLSVGIENAQELWADLDRALRSAASKERV